MRINIPYMIIIPENLATYYEVTVCSGDIVYKVNRSSGIEAFTNNKMKKTFGNDNGLILFPELTLVPQTSLDKALK